MKSVENYMKLKYKVELICLDDDTFSAEIPDIPGLCAYGATEIEAIKELEHVKRAAFGVMIQQNKHIPMPTRKFEIPIDELNKMPYRAELEKFVIA